MKSTKRVAKAKVKAKRIMIITDTCSKEIRWKGAWQCANETLKLKGRQTERKRERERELQKASFLLLNETAKFLCLFYAQAQQKNKKKTLGKTKKK